MKYAVFCRETAWTTSAKVSTRVIAEHIASRMDALVWLSSTMRIIDLVTSRKNRQIRNQYLRMGIWDGNVLAYTGLSLSPYTPRLPIARSSVFLRKAMNWTVPNIRWVLNRHGFKVPPVLVWAQSPDAEYLYKQYPAAVKVWHATDDNYFFHPDKVRYFHVEKQLFDAADLIICVSDVLRQRLMSRHPHLDPRKLRVLRHGTTPCNTDAKVSRADGIIHAVYIGNTKRADLKELEHISRMRNVCVHIIGDSSCAGMMENTDGIVFHGKKQLDDALRIMSGCHVGLLSYSADELIKVKRGGNPMKAYDYLSAGLPILARQMDVLEESGIPYEQYSTLDEAEEKLRCLHRDYEVHSKNARDFAARNSWTKRFRELDEMLNEWAI